MHIFDGTNTDFSNGMIIIFNKPQSWTSFDVVNKTRYIIKNKLGIKKIKVGHAGTLDPLATGVLVVCTGKATKTISELTCDDKEYLATLQFGATTPSFDAETEPNQFFNWEHLTTELIDKTLQLFTGDISQTPPIYSAIKVNGVRAYKEARKGNTIDIPTRTVKIYDIKKINMNLPELNLLVHCSKGTYIRSLANDIGQELKSGAYLKDLVRTRSGNFLLENALDIKEFEKIVNLM